MFLPQLEDVFALPIVKGDTALSPGQADRHFPVVWHSRTGCLRILVKAEAPAPQDAVHILPGPGRDVVQVMRPERPTDQLLWGWSLWEDHGCYRTSSPVLGPVISTWPSPEAPLCS